MNTTAASTRFPDIAQDISVVQSEVEAVPWYAWTSVLATTCICIGLYWDICWHFTVGRDTFWTAPHLFVQFGGILGGTAGALLIFGATFGHHRREIRESCVRILGFWGPLGAFLSAWGAALMVLSAPFDDWWHRAYGLDVTFISPPHQLLAQGFESINFGGIILVIGLLNRVEGALHKRLQWMLLTLGGMVLVNSMIGRLGFTDRSQMHGSAMYLGIATGAPFVLETIARASRVRWARTAVAGIYTLFFALGVWIMPLFAAEPKLAPVYHHITHMVPISFPILLLAPAFSLDVLWRKLNAIWPDPGFGVKWLQAAIAGIVFVPALIAAQWPFADFLMLPASRNWVFGTLNFPYMVPPDSYSVRNLFIPFEGLSHFLVGLAWAVFAATLCSRLGILFGNWMRKVKR